MNFCQCLESEIRYYSAAGVHYYQYTLGYPGIFSILKSYTVVKYSEWYLNIRWTHEPWGGWKSNFFSPVAALFQSLETNLIPGLLPLDSPNSLMAAEPCDHHSPEHILLLFLHCSSGGASTPWETNSRAELAVASQPFGENRSLLVLVMASSHLSLLCYCFYNLTPELLPLPCSPWSWPPCSFPPVLSLLSLLFVFHF